MIRNSRRTARLAALVLAATAAAGAVTAAGPTVADAGPRAPRATLADLRIGVKPITDDSSAGSSYVDLTFTNVSRHRVSLDGYSGVSLVAYDNGTQVGRPATWLTNRRPVRVVLKPGQTTTEIVTIRHAELFGRGHRVTADGFRVYPPGSRGAAFVRYRVKASTRNVHQLAVDPVGARI